MADVEALLGALTLEEKAELTAGGDMFATAAIERVGIPRVNVTDGPNGARGQAYPGIAGAPSTCIPCGSALGATWDPELVERLGALLGKEALDRGCRGLLAPTVNLHRSPLAGRNFECYSEDPLLSGRLAAAYVRGVQSTGVFATVKHFVGNEAEHERNSMSSVVDDRSLRELYLVPFELAVREGGALAIMTGYNRLNGHWLTEQPRFLLDILRQEWGFEGLVMTDWFAVADSNTSLGAGLDLEMPGPGRELGTGIAALVREGTVPEADLDAAVRRLLGGFARCGILDAPTPPAEPKGPSPAERDLIRRAATEATVLLRNDGVLPLDVGSLRRVAVVGDHAGMPRIQGGGSARVVERTIVNPVDALGAALGSGVELVFARGCEVDRSATPLGHSALPAPAGFEVEVFDGLEFGGDVVHRAHLDELRLLVFSAPAQGYPDGDWSMRVRGTVVPNESGRFELALAQSGRARVLVDGTTVLDGFASPPPPGGSDFFGFASQELVGEIELVARQPVEVVVEYARIEAMLSGVRVGFRTVDTDALLARAVEAAGSADVAVVFVGDDARVGDRRQRSDDAGAARAPGRTGAPGGGRQPAHGGSGERGGTGRTAVGRRRGRAAAVLVRRRGDGPGGGRHPHRRVGTGRPVAHHDPATAGAQPLARQLPGRERRAALRRRALHGLSGLRASMHHAALPVRARSRVHQLRAGGAPAVGGHVHTRWHAHRVGRGAQRRRSGRDRGGAVLRGA